jgi:hypothetical protein
MRNCAHLWYLAQFVLEWETLQAKVLEKIKTHFMFSKFLPGANGGGEMYAQGFGGEAWGKETIGETQT